MVRLKTNTLFWVFTGGLFLLYYQSHFNVDQMSTEHRRHLVDMQHRIDREKARQLLEASEAPSDQEEPRG